MTNFIINKDFERHKDQMEFPLENNGILIRDGEQFFVKGKEGKIIVYPGCILIDINKKEATVFVIKNRLK